MLGWKTKLVFIAIVFFAGYATAVYNAMPKQASDDLRNFSYEESSLVQSFRPDTQQMLSSNFNKYLAKSICIAKQVVSKTCSVVKQQIEQKMQERQMASNK